uniref:Protein kinase domain-containing protein n=1 Tax=Setaria viridis TaxID=4556 RepID=A0A4U6SWH3_SETVI|nr:hypothetical protein SEVIR_9G207400v2 [Setaria viridis]
MKQPHVATVASLLALAAAATTAAAVTFDATNSASNTPGGQRFDQAVGLDYAKRVLSDASTFIWNTFNQPSPDDRKPVDKVTLVVEDIDGVAFTSANGIHLSAKYVGGYSGDVKKEVTGVLYHEVTHVWQWNGQGRANGGLIEGIADYVQLKAGYAPGSWVLPGQGRRWDQGYDVTARFLDYCDSLKPGFVAQLNAKMKDGYTDDFFAQILGKSVQQLWQDYKAAIDKDCWHWFINHRQVHQEFTQPLCLNNGCFQSTVGDDNLVPDDTTPSQNNSKPSGSVPGGTTPRHNNSYLIILSIAIPVGITLCLISAIVICALRRTTRSRQQTLSCAAYSEDIEEIQALLLDAVVIRAATDNFDEVNKLGEGGFGQVYKGLLPDGLEIAVKRLSKESSKEYVS